ncbi:MAG: GAF domain-containing protein [Magnetococcales bacterium]|nr:GAF domain-containing protein [Magnetococcales bacterium]MBF0113687.1 GAF domain-containing protein [Magnetococcales bacterium]
MSINSISRTLLELQLRLGSTHRLEQLSPLITQAASALCGADRASLFLLDWERMELCSHAASGVAGDIRLALKMGIVGLAFLRREIINVVDAYNVPFFNREVDHVTGYRTETVLVVPLTDGQNRVLGALQLLNKQEGCFSQEDEEKLAAAARAIATPEFFQTLDEAQAKTLVDHWVAEMVCERGTFFVLNSQEGTLRSLYATGLEGKPAIGVRVNLGIAGWVVFTGRSLVIEDAYQSEFFNPESDQQTGYHTRNIIAVPLKSNTDEPLGVLEIINKQGAEQFSADDLETVQALAAIASVSLENALLIQEHETQFHSFIQVMAASIDAKDTLTAGHSQLVSEYACGIAQEMGLSQNDVDVVRVAGFLHDYGKLGVADVVLKKGGPLTKGEYDQIKEHVSYTREILTRMRFSRKYRHVPEIAASHHEYMDGSGYGVGLLNRYIPFLAKIITVADIFEALTADRHYRRRMPAEEALAILKQGAGKKFDAAIIDAMERYWLKRSGVVSTTAHVPLIPLHELPVTAMSSRAMEETGNTH